MARGGYRKPMNPAPVSGPGSLSQRTDGGPGDAKYVSGLGWGEGQKFYDTQVSGNDALRKIEQPNMPTTGLTNIAPSQSLIGLNIPTQMPDIPVTDGADAGAGRGMSALGLQPQDLANYTTAKDVIQSLASNPNASPATKYLGQRIGGSY